MGKPEKILEILEQNGYEAYYVGGCVRDLLLKRPVHDWDITTSALPQQTMACFSHCVPTGIAHGTVTVIEGECAAEVTTFRSDGDYRDGRHPDRVTFVPSLGEDLARRDFTVNAMAMDRAGRIIDPMDGRADLEGKRLRCVGDPDRRFREDALRMLRALRFSAQLGFSVVPETWEAIGRNASLCAVLSAERVRDEVEKTLVSSPAHVGRMIELGLLRAFSLTEDRGLCRLSELPAAPVVRWAGLCRLYPELELSAFRLDRHTCKTAMAAAAAEKPRDDVQWKRLIAEEGTDTAAAAAALWGEEAELSRILESGHCLTLKDLAVSGRDLPWPEGRQVGCALHRLLEHVWRHPQDNDRETLLRLLHRETEP